MVLAGAAACPLGSSLVTGGTWASAGTTFAPLSNPFPLKVLPEGGPLGKLSSRTRQRRARARHLDTDTSEALHAINWFAGSKDLDKTGTCDLLSRAFDQPELYSRMRESVSEQTDGAAIPGQQAAFNELLHGRSIYSADGTGGINLASYSTPQKVSLPTSTRDAPRLSSLVQGTAAAHFYEEGTVERMLRPQSELDAEPCLITPFWDVVLRHSRRKRIRFYRHLLRIGLLDVAPRGTAVEELGVLFE